MDWWNTLPETNITHGNRPSQKETSIPTIHLQVRAVSLPKGNLLTSGQTKSPKSFPGWKAHFLGVWDRQVGFCTVFLHLKLVVIARILFATWYHHIYNFYKDWAFVCHIRGRTRFELNNPTLIASRFMHPCFSAGTEWNWNNWRNVKFQKASSEVGDGCLEGNSRLEWSAIYVLYTHIHIYIYMIYRHTAVDHTDID